jgi:hypothetical protein
MMDENFVIEAKFMWNAFAVFSISGRLQFSLFATVDGIPIASGRRKTLACQNDNALSLCDLSCGYFINL